MYYTIKHLKNLGYDLSDATVKFKYSLDLISGLSINAEQFVKAADRLPQETKNLWAEVISSKKAFEDFINFLETTTQDKTSKILITLFHIRNIDPDLSTPHLAQLAKQLSSSRLSQEEIKSLLDALFKIKVDPRFSYYPIYFTTHEDSIKQVLGKFKSTLLENLTNTKQDEIIRTVLQTY